MLRWRWTCSLKRLRRERDRVKHTGSGAFHDGDHDRVETSLARLKVLAGFQGKAEALLIEWRKLAIPTGHVGSGQLGSGRRNFGKLPKGRRTPEQDFIDPILRVLKEMGGQGRTAVVVKRVGEIMQPVLCDVDYEGLASDAKPRWEKAVNWARDHMVRDGLLRSDSPRGTWGNHRRRPRSP